MPWFSARRCPLAVSTKAVMRSPTVSGQWPAGHTIVRSPGSADAVSGPWPAVHTWYALQAIQLQFPTVPVTIESHRPGTKIIDQVKKPSTRNRNHRPGTETTKTTSKESKPQTILKPLPGHRLPPKLPTGHRNHGPGTETTYQAPQPSTRQSLIKHRDHQQGT